MNKTFPHLLLIPFLLAGCGSPLDSPDAGPVFDTRLNQVIEREMKVVNEWETEAGTARVPSAVEEALAHQLRVGLLRELGHAEFFHTRT